MGERDLPDWLERTDALRATVHLTETDHAVILPLPLDIRHQFGGLWDTLLSVLPEDLREWLVALDEREERPGAAELWREVRPMIRTALDAENQEPVLELLDELLARCVHGWVLTDACEALGWEDPMPVPGSVRTREERLPLYDRLPVTYVARLVRGILEHSGNC